MIEGRGDVLGSSQAVLLAAGDHSSAPAAAPTNYLVFVYFVIQLQFVDAEKDWINGSDLLEVVSQPTEVFLATGMMSQSCYIHVIVLNMMVNFASSS